MRLDGIAYLSTFAGTQGTVIRSWHQRRVRSRRFEWPVDSNGPDTLSFVVSLAKSNVGAAGRSICQELSVLGAGFTLLTCRTKDTGARFHATKHATLKPSCGSENQSVARRDQDSRRQSASKSLSRQKNVESRQAAAGNYRNQKAFAIYSSAVADGHRNESQSPFNTSRQIASGLSRAPALQHVSCHP